jgi:photosystem II stability/assembly factor-like uncharacterized protein
VSTSTHKPAKQESKGRRAPLWIAISVLLLAALAVWLYASRNPGNVALGQVSGDLHALQFAPGDRIFYGQHSGLQISTDGGGTWTAPSGTGDAMAIASSPKTPEVIYQAGHDLFLKSSDGGETWTEPGFGNLPGTDIHGFAVAPETGTLYANIAGQGLYRSTEGGNNWEFVTSATAGAMALAAGPGTPSVLYAATMDQGIIRSDDGGQGGQNWQQTAVVPGMSMSGLYVHPESGNVYVTGQEGVYKSTDRGETWTVLGPDEPMALVAAKPEDEAQLVAISQQGKVYRSDDGGQTWAK